MTEKYDRETRAERERARVGSCSQLEATCLLPSLLFQLLRGLEESLAGH